MYPPPRPTALLSVRQHRHVCLSSFVCDPVPGTESAPLNMTLTGLTSDWITDPFKPHVGMALVSDCLVEGVRQDYHLVESLGQGGRPGL